MVWPDSGPRAWEESAASEPLLHLPDEGKHWDYAQWYVRDLPLQFDMLVENVLDISHTPYAHHGVLGRREGGGEVPMKLVEGSYSPQGFAVDAKQQFNTEMMGMRIHYNTPGVVRYRWNLRGDPTLSMTILVSPTSLGHSRVFLSIGAARRKQQPLPAKIFRHVLLNVPWLDHIMARNAVFDGDTYMLHLSERELLTRASNNISRGYYLPASSEVSVATWRKWINEFGGQVPTLPRPGQSLPPALTKKEAIHRYEQHTKHCKSCQKAAANFALLRTVSTTIGAIAACVTLTLTTFKTLQLTGALAASPAASTAITAATAASATAAAPATAGASLLAGLLSLLTLVGPWAALAAVCGCLALFAGKVHQKFYFEDWVYPDRK